MTTEEEKAKAAWTSYWNQPGIAESFGGKEDLEKNPKYVLEEKPISELVPKCETILDAGCGVGRYTALIKDKCTLYVGVDYSKSMLEQARKNNPYENVIYVEADLATTELPLLLKRAEEQFNLKLDDAPKFDVGLLIAIIRHLPTEKGLAVLRNVRQACKTLYFTATIIPEEKEIPTIIKGSGDNKIIDIPYHLSDIKKTLQTEQINAMKIGDRDPTEGVRYLFYISDKDAKSLTISIPKMWNRLSEIRRLIGIK